MTKMLSRSRSATIKVAIKRAEAEHGSVLVPPDKLMSAVRKVIPDVTHREVVDAIQSLTRRLNRRTDELERTLEARLAYKISRLTSEPPD